MFTRGSLKIKQIDIKLAKYSLLCTIDQGVTTQRKRSSAGSIQRSIEVVPTRAGSLHSISSSEGSS